MLSENRKYHFIGELTLERSHLLDKQSRPKDDIVNWLFLKEGDKQFSFVYKIENPLEAEYGKPFKADLAFTMIEALKNIIQINHTYEVLRANELIGIVKIIKMFS